MYLKYFFAILIAGQPHHDQRKVSLIDKFAYVNHIQYNSQK